MVIHPSQISQILLTNLNYEKNSIEGDMNLHNNRPIILESGVVFSTSSKNTRLFFRNGESGFLIELMSIPKAQEAIVSIVIVCQSLK